MLASRLVNLENENNKLKKQCPNLQDESEPAQSAGGQEQAGSFQGVDKPYCADDSSRRQTEALAAAWLAVLPSLTMAQLLEHMDPSQLAAVKEAAARELARRLRQDEGAKPF